MEYRYCTKPKQSGIALIQVILITSVLTALAIYLTTTARQQVRMAQLAQDKSAAYVNVESALARTTYLMLTELNTTEANNLSRNYSGWNYHGSPFNITNETQIEIQDQAGLIHAHFPDKSLLNKLFVNDGVSLSDAKTVTDNLLAWQVTDSIVRDGIFGTNGSAFGQYSRQGAVPDTSDFSHVTGVTQQILTLLTKYTSVHRKGSFNPMNSPKPILSALMGKTAADIVTKQREEGALNRRRFRSLSGLTESDDMFLATSNYMSLSITSSVGDSYASRTVVMYLRPHATSLQQPINILSNRS
ncbi:hypothetical protein [Thalassotalea fusca]